MTTTFKKPKKNIDPAAAEALAESLADKPYDSPKDIETADEPMKPLHFLVPASLHKEFKQYAVEKDISMKDLFKEMYREYRKNHS